MFMCLSRQLMERVWCLLESMTDTRSLFGTGREERNLLQLGTANNTIVQMFNYNCCWLYMNLLQMCFLFLHTFTVFFGFHRLVSDQTAELSDYSIIKQSCIRFYHFGSLTWTVSGYCFFSVSVKKVFLFKLMKWK